MVFTNQLPLESTDMTLLTENDLKYLTRFWALKSNNGGLFEFSNATEPSLGRWDVNHSHITSIIDALGTQGFLAPKQLQNHIVDKMAILI